MPKITDECRYVVAVSNPSNPRAIVRVIAKFEFASHAERFAFAMMDQYSSAHVIGVYPADRKGEIDFGSPHSTRAGVVG